MVRASPLSDPTWAPTAACSSPSKKKKRRKAPLQTVRVAAPKPLIRKPQSSRVAGPRVAARGAARVLAHGAEKAAFAALNLSFPQGREVSPPTLQHFHAEACEFRAWARRARLQLGTAHALDRAVVEYLDKLFFDGFQAERRDKLLAPLQFHHPELETASTGSFPEARASLQYEGFAAWPTASRGRSSQRRL